MIKAVLDTNILISALIRPDGLEARVFRLGAEGRFTICVSHDLWLEYEEVLGRKKFDKQRERAFDLVKQLAAVVTYYFPTGELEVSTDPDDNRLLECAQAAEADYLLTGNIKDFPNQWKGTRVRSARNFLNDCGWLESL